MLKTFSLKPHGSALRKDIHVHQKLLHDNNVKFKHYKIQGPVKKYVDSDAVKLLYRRFDVVQSFKKLILTRSFF